MRCLHKTNACRAGHVKMSVSPRDPAREPLDEIGLNLEQVLGESHSSVFWNRYFLDSLEKYTSSVK